MRLAWLDGSGPNKGGPPSAVGGATRLAAVIRRAVDVTGYASKRQRKTPGHGIGLAASSAPEDSNQPSWTVCVAEVACDGGSGAVTVEKLTVLSDVGTAVNPDGVRAQIESATLALSVALYERATFENGRFEEDDFDRYRIALRIRCPSLTSISSVTANIPLVPASRQ